MSTVTQIEGAYRKGNARKAISLFLKDTFFN